MTDPYARYTRLKFDRPHPKVLRVTMDNGRMNTADEAMHAELADIWRDIDRDDSVHVAILAGAGKVFSAGGDFNMIRSATEDFNARARQWKEAREMVYGVINCNKPVVSAMRGVAVGAGLVCGILADVSIATKDCRIIDGHTRLGRRSRRPRRDRLAAALRSRQGEILPADLRSDFRRGSRAHRLDNLRGRRRSTRSEIDRGRHQARRRGAERDPLDQELAQQLAARDGPDLRRLAGAWSFSASAGRR